MIFRRPLLPTSLVRTALASGQLLNVESQLRAYGAASRVCDERSGQKPKRRTAVDSPHAAAAVSLNYA